MMPDLLNVYHCLSFTLSQMDNHIEYSEYYIGVTKRRKHGIGAEKTFLSFHFVHGGNNRCILVKGTSIKVHDQFQFYYTDPAAALASCKEASASLRSLNLGCNSRNSYQAAGAAGNADKAEVFGGLMFASRERGSLFFDRPNVDSSPFVENFPGAPLAGIFCDGEIGCCSMRSDEQGSQGESSTRCCCHVYSTIYLVMSVTPISTC
ncbi:hypothetical protein BT93_B0032 [Corymbia citriodora subsp. variegata]|nr:hypothetical protein BT93_B0032 [Corymbia citriodora subsp. variegata]